MSFIITHNNFGNDSLALRLWRLMLLSTYIGDRGSRAYRCEFQNYNISYKK